MKIQVLIIAASVIAPGSAILSAQTILPASSSGNTGAAPVGIAATLSPTPELLFTQPFTAGEQTRGVYSVNTTSGMSSLVFTLPELGEAENYIAIAPGLGGFPAGGVYTTGISPTNAANEAVYKNGALFINGLPSSDQHAGVTFDTAGTFNGDLIVTLAGSVNGYTSTGALDFTYPLAAAGDVLEGATVTPLTDAACPGCLYVTGATSGNIDNPQASGNGFIFLIKPGTPSGTVITTPWATLTGRPEPEGVVYVDNSSANNPACSLPGAAGARYSFFVSGYATDPQRDGQSATPTNGGILAYTQSMLAGVVGQLLVPTEGSLNAAVGPGVVLAISQTNPASQTIFSSTAYQLEGSTILTCAGGGCPATQGFWKHHPFPFASLTIGNFTYTDAQLVNILNTAPKGGDAALILGHQLIAAIANYDAGAQQSASVSAAIGESITLLANLDLTSSSTFVAASSVLGQEMTTLSNTLDSYNSATGLNCSEGNGLSD